MEATASYKDALKELKRLEDTARERRKEAMLNGHSDDLAASQRASQRATGAALMLAYVFAVDLTSMCDDLDALEEEQ